MFDGTRGSPKAPTRIASKSRASLANPSGGTVVPSARYRSAPQSKLVSSTGALVATIAFTAWGMTSLPIPSPGMTAIFFFDEAVPLTAKRYHKQWSVVSGRWAVANSQLPLSMGCPDTDGCAGADHWPLATVRYNQDNGMNLVAQQESP